jgi:hypothetical protein
MAVLCNRCFGPSHPDPIWYSHWLPGYNTPEHLDGSMPGDFGEKRLSGGQHGCRDLYHTCSAPNCMYVQSPCNNNLVCLPCAGFDPFGLGRNPAALKW